MPHGYDNTLQDRDSFDDAGCPETQRFDTFSREHYGGLLQFVRRRTTNEEDARDVTQESLTRLLRYRETEEASAWKPLLYRIAVNVIGEQFRRSSARKASRHVSLEEMDIPSEAPQQEDLIEQQQREALLRAAILSLPARPRQVYLLSRMDGLSYKQIANHCGISVKTVEKHMTQALALLDEKVGFGVADASN